MKSTLNYLVLLIANLIFTFQGGECLSQEDAGSLLQYFKEDDPTKVSELIDPLMLPPKIGGGPAPHINDGKLSGLSRLKIESLIVDFKELKASFKCIVPELVLTGEYLWQGFVDPDHTYEGELRYSFTAFQVNAELSMLINSKGDPQVSDLVIKILMDNMELKMTDISPEQRLMLAFGDTFLCEITDMITQLVKRHVLNFANNYLERMVFVPPSNDAIYGWSSQIATEHSHVEYLMRRILQASVTEPFRIPPLVRSRGDMKITITDSKIEGISFIGEIETLSIQYENKKLYFKLSITYPHLTARTYIDINDHLTNVILEMEDVKVAFNMMFDLSLKEPPKLQSFRIKMGSFKKGYNKQSKIQAQQCRKLEPPPLHDEFNAVFSSDNHALLKFIQDNLNKINWESVIMMYLS